jgi:glycosyltransferase involved in cell wall biosynthesis
MRILIVMLSVGFAGTERHTLELANELARQGHQVGLVLRRRPSEPHRQAAFAALRGEIADGITIFEARRTMPMLALWQALWRFRPDVIHAHHERAVRLCARHAGRVPVIGTIHVHFRPEIYGSCAGLICLTEAEAAAIPDSYRGAVCVIGNWVRPHPRPDAARLADLRAGLGLAPGDQVIGTVARLEPVKNVAELIEAFHAARLPDAQLPDAQLSDTRLLIVGDGSQRATLAALADRLGLAGRVIFTGFRPDVRDLYFLFDLFVLNAADEPFGLVILEAAAAGVPVIAVASAGPAAIARELPISLVPPGAEILAGALRAAYRRPAPAYNIAGFAVEDKTRAAVAFYNRCAEGRRVSHSVA